MDTRPATSDHDRALAAMTRILKVAVPLAISVGLVIWLFHKVNVAQVKEIISRGVDYRYIFLMMALTVASHVIRGIRWGIQLRAAGVPRMSPVAESVSIFGAYALNLVFPFIGEAWRCVFVARRERCKLSTVVGTDLGDRASDGLMIGLLLILTVVVANPAITRFLDRYPLGESIHRVATDPAVWIIAVAILAAAVIADRLLRHTPFVQGINRSCRRIWDGFAVLFHMKGIGLYAVLTIGIWLCYYLQAYVCFFAFPFTRELVTAPGAHLGLLAGLVVFVFGSCSMIVPSNGGLGPWNIAVMFALSLFGVSDTDGAAFSIVCWSMQSATLIACGLFSAAYIALTRKSTGA